MVWFVFHACKSEKEGMSLADGLLGVYRECAAAHVMLSTNKHENHSYFSMLFTSLTGRLPGCVGSSRVSSSLSVCLFLLSSPVESSWCSSPGSRWPHSFPLCSSSPLCLVLLYLLQQTLILAVPAVIFHLVIYTRLLRYLTSPLQSIAQTRLFGWSCLLTRSSVYQKLNQMLVWCNRLQMKQSGT